MGVHREAVMDNFGIFTNNIALLLPSIALNECTINNVMLFARNDIERKASMMLSIK
jgi:hypothetical protein